MLLLELVVVWEGPLLISLCFSEESEELDVWCPFSLLLRLSLYYIMNHVVQTPWNKYVGVGQTDRLYQVEKVA